VDQGAPSSSAIRDALVPEIQAPEALFVQQISREMTYPARPLPVLPDASGAVITAQMEASQQVAYDRQAVPASRPHLHGRDPEALAPK
jgi:hypothetical protein